jgi:diguanylate cyclase (GGDEF)-like protein/PAS domain S-box-containing protein
LRAEVAQQTLDLRQSNSELRSKEQHLQVLLAAAPVGMLELDAADRCRYLNAIGATLCACTPGQALGRHLMDFVHPEDRVRLEQAWARSHHDNTVQSLEFRLSGSGLWCAGHWMPAQAAEGTVLVLTDATARRQQYEQLWTLAHHDPLTQLPNRNLFWDRCTQALSVAKRHGSGAAMLLLDLDGFKGVNDRLGHAAGDVLLQQVAQRLKGRIRDSDTVARLGGDEFAVVMPDIGDAEAAARVAADLLASLEPVFDLPQGQTQICASIGLALFPQHAQEVEALAKCADMAMYSAKHGGRNRVQLWHADCQPKLC